MTLVETSDGGFAIACYKQTFGNISTDSNTDFWLVKIDANGRMLWNKTYDRAAMDQAHSLVVTSDGGFALAGATNSFGAGQYDFWLVKTEPIATPTATPKTVPFPTVLITVALGAPIAATAAYLIYHHKKRTLN